MALPTNRAPARAGDDVQVIDTPALLLRIEAFQNNLVAVARATAAAGVKLRAHAKAHKCVEIARRQVAAGAVGICCQKVAEAEVFVEAGIADVLVSNEIVGDRKADRLAALAEKSRIGVCVDDPLQVEQLAGAARRRRVSIDVLIEIDVGQGRCGVATPNEALALAHLVSAATPHLRLRGLQAYHGKAQHLRDPAARKQTIEAASIKAAAVRAALVGAGFPCAEISGGGTGSLVNELASKVYTEVQPGSYVLMDADYSANRRDLRDPTLRQALYVLCTVISVRAGHAVLDAGLKSMSAESGLPQSAEPGWSVISMSDEHVVIEPDGSGRALAVGDKLRLIPSHCDPTVNLHDWVVVMRGETVEAVWPIDARGAMF